MSYYPLNPTKINPFYLLFILPTKNLGGWFFEEVLYAHSMGKNQRSYGEDCSKGLVDFLELDWANLRIKPIFL